MSQDRRELYHVNKLFCGSKMIENFTVIVERNVVKHIIPTSEVTILPDDVEYKHYLAVPAFVDIQIYGAHGKLLSEYMEIQTLRKIYEYSKNGGACFFQPTISSQSYEVIYSCIDVVKQYMKEGGSGCIGIHLEGPWINPIKRGAHIEKFIHSPTFKQVSDLLDYGRGVITMITLAPEVVDASTIDLIHSHGIVVSAGHSDASYLQATHSFDTSKIKTVTHLYNAMSAFNHRAPGLVGAVLDHPTVMSSIVPDGYHVDFSAIRIAKTIMQNRIFAITDAVTDCKQGPIQHYLAGNKYECDGVLSGSALTMLTCLQNLVNNSKIDLEEALRMVSLYPASVVGIQEKAGSIFFQECDIGRNNILFLSGRLELEGMVTSTFDCSSV